MKKKTVNFRFLYLNFVAVLVILVAAALFYVRSVLEDYENSSPEALPLLAIHNMVHESREGQFWDRAGLPWKFETSRLESGINVRQAYTKKMQESVFEFELKPGNTDPDKMVYVGIVDGTAMAEITLRATSETMTKLAILTYRNWEIESVKPIFEQREYTLTVPADFRVKINGLELSEEEIISQTQTDITYTTHGLYLKPEVEIVDAEGKEVSYQIADDKIVAEFYYYDLTLPATLKLELNGKNAEGVLENGLVKYQIRELKKPELVLKDYYGNQFKYEGGNEIPLTYLEIKVDSRYQVLVKGVQAPMDVVTVGVNPEFDVLSDYVPNLPRIHTYEIAVLAADAEVQVVNQDNIAVAVDGGKFFHDYVGQAGNMGEVPREVAAEVDVLAIAQEWSLFMSNDRSFEDISAYMVKDCYQYEVAKKYANSVDRKFFSSHTLLDPAFTDSEVKHFVWIADNCFSVDISFVKRMALKSGRKVEDDMNDRFFFVKWDDTADKVDNPTWKIVSMKEIVSHEE